MVKWLTANKADPNAISNGVGAQKETALLQACRAQNYACAEMLIVYGADPYQSVGNQCAFSVLLSRFRSFEAEADQHWRNAVEEGLFVMPSSVEELRKELSAVSLMIGCDRAESEKVDWKPVCVCCLYAVLLSVLSLSVLFLFRYLCCLCLCCLYLCSLDLLYTLLGSYYCNPVCACVEPILYQHAYVLYCANQTIL